MRLFDPSMLTKEIRMKCLKQTVDTGGERVKEVTFFMDSFNQMADFREIRHERHIIRGTKKSLIIFTLSQLLDYYSHKIGGKR
jgi:hypothetical protein